MAVIVNGAGALYGTFVNSRNPLSLIERQAISAKPIAKSV
jgi:hypothetical protein